MQFDPDLIDRVRDACDLAELIGEYTKVKRTAKGLTARCPFLDHVDKGLTFSISRESQLYYCYGCKRGGNAFTFLQSFCGLTFPEALKFLAERARIELPQPVALSPAMTISKLHEVNRLAAEFYHQQLMTVPANTAALSYLQSRGLGSEVLKTFQIGFAPNEGGVLRYLQERDVPLELAEQLGLCVGRKNSEGKEIKYELFRDRVMFPIISEVGAVDGFGGRSLTEGFPKYLNSVASAIFKKRHALYGINETAHLIHQKNSVIIVEGFTDALRLYSVGIENVVATLGTSLTIDQVEHLKLLTTDFVLMFDGDQSGLTAMERSLALLIAAGIDARAVRLPSNLDPDSAVTELGLQSVRKLINGASSLFELVLSEYWQASGANDVSGKLKVLRKAAPVLTASENNQVLRTRLVVQLGQALGLSFDWMLGYLEGIKVATSNRLNERGSYDS